MFSDDMLTAEDNQKETNTPPKIESCELVDTQGFDGNFGAFSEGSKKWGFEPHFLIKKQGLKPKFKPSVSTGWELITSFEQLKKHRISIASSKDSLKYAVERLGLS